jgi:hypothetical protein
MSTKTVMDRMKWTTTVALTAVALLVAPSGSRGQEPRPTRMVWGVGGIHSCGQYVTAREDGRRTGVNLWETAYYTWLGVSSPA